VPAGRASHDLFVGEKTASASESLARNLAANATNGEETVHAPYHGPAGGMPSRPQKRRFRSPNAPGSPWLIIINLPGLANARRLSFTGAACDSFPRFRPACCCLPPRQHRPTAVSSSSRTRPMVTGSISVWREATSVAHMPRCPIANRAISPRHRPTSASIRMKSRAQFPGRWAELARMPVAPSTSPLPANADACVNSGIDVPAATSAPWKRRDAAPRSGYVKAALAAP
jgi:hypothetical protein